MFGKDKTMEKLREICKDSGADFVMECRRMRNFAADALDQVDYCINKCPRAVVCAEGLKSIAQKAGMAGEPKLKAGDRIIIGMTPIGREETVAEVSPSGKWFRIAPGAWLSTEDIGSIEVLAPASTPPVMITGDELKTLGNTLGEVVHSEWMKARAEEKGWHHPRDCPVITHDGNESKDPHCPNCHTCMVPFADLPDSEKKLTMMYPGVFLVKLESMGYRIVKK